MVDTRFHSFAGPIPLAALLASVGLSADALDGETPIIDGADELELAGPTHIALAAQLDYREALRATGAGAVVVSAELRSDVPAGTISIVAKDTFLSFVDILDQLYPQSTRGTVVGLLGPHESLPFTESDVRLGPGVVLGPGVEIGRGTVIGPNTVIGAGVSIGRNCIIGSNCSIECAHLGNGVVLSAGVRVGTEGFGWLDHGRSNRKIPQLGRVILQDRVEIGANSCVDRAKFGSTVVGDGTKIDNLVQIGHGCRIGRSCVICGHVGISGSVVIGDGVVLGGKVGIADNVEIGSGAKIAAFSGVMNNVPAGATWMGQPAGPAGEWRRIYASLRRMGRRSGTDEV